MVGKKDHLEIPIRPMTGQKIFVLHIPFHSNQLHSAFPCIAAQVETYIQHNYKERKHRWRLLSYFKVALTMYSKKIMLHVQRKVRQSGSRSFLTSLYSVLGAPWTRGVLDSAYTLLLRQWCCWWSRFTIMGRRSNKIKVFTRWRQLRCSSIVRVFICDIYRIVYMWSPYCCAKGVCQVYLCLFVPFWHPESKGIDRRHLNDSLISIFWCHK